MQIMVRDRSIAELAESLSGKKVLIWTCNTCARLCNVGGSMNAQRVASALRSEGIDVVAVRSAKASCLAGSVAESAGLSEMEYDVVLALTCDVGSKVARAVFGKDVVNPVVTLGPGYMDAGGRPVLLERDTGTETALDDFASSHGLCHGPFV